ncbi:uncharacterized protein N7506_008751 [Penicillium brevicompactum]|uniref:uncharacterized protein n=1 Tax=Penicillium brevicompactum TaxID=5074 RepID=UPI002540625D|nr:uncharacterized protein N7506_008751 [Penicillium brevicompactum]KAJ5325649.1 hypothetical protein N7506_008751 [Penicillium brevicompactum]
MVRLSIHDILTVVITNPATTTSGRRRHPFFRSSDAFRNSQTETPPTENDCDRLAAKSLLAYMRRSFDDILTVVITNLATTTSDRRRHPFSGSSDAFRNSQTETPPIEMTVIATTTSDRKRDPFFRSSDAFHDSQTETPPIETAMGMLVKTRLRINNILTVMITRSGYHHVWPQT